MCDNESSVRQNRSFLERIEINKIVLGLENAKAEQVSDFRMGLLSVYRIANIRDFLPNDKEALVELQTGVQNLLDCNKGVDKIVQLPYSWLVSNIEAILENY